MKQTLETNIDKKQIDIKQTNRIQTNKQKQNYVTCRLSEGQMEISESSSFAFFRKSDFSHLHNTLISLLLNLYAQLNFCAYGQQH